jgi:CheY-like chemotaxis protein
MTRKENTEAVLGGMYPARQDHEMGGNNRSDDCEPEGDPEGRLLPIDSLYFHETARPIHQDKIAGHDGPNDRNDRIDKLIANAFNSFQSNGNETISESESPPETDERSPVDSERKASDTTNIPAATALPVTETPSSPRQSSAADDAHCTGIGTVTPRSHCIPMAPPSPAPGPGLRSPQTRSSSRKSLSLIQGSAPTTTTATATATAVSTSVASDSVSAFKVSALCGDSTPQRRSAAEILTPDGKETRIDRSNASTLAPSASASASAGASASASAASASAASGSGDGVELPSVERVMTEKEERSESSGSGSTQTQGSALKSGSGSGGLGPGESESESESESVARGRGRDQLSNWLAKGNSLEAAPALAAPMHMHRSEGLRVLLVEDTSIYERLMNGALVQMCCDVTTVAHGGHALNFLKTQPFDICFIDLCTVSCFAIIHFIFAS